VTTTPRVSVAIPLFNEEQIVPELVQRLCHTLESIPGGPHEIVFVHDGRAAGTFAMLTEAAARDPRIVAIALSRNFGHQLAITAALDHVSGAGGVGLGGDLQAPPEA